MHNMVTLIQNQIKNELEAKIEKDRKDGEKGRIGGDLGDDLESNTFRLDDSNRKDELIDTSDEVAVLLSG
jgi:uncharacterized protein (UPF0371 family)